MCMGPVASATNLNKSRRSIRCLGDLLPPSPPAEKATAELMLYLERAACALDVLSISGVPALPVSTDIEILYGFHQNNSVVIQKRQPAPRLWPSSR